ncbi:uncharacterized protein PAC_16200 [Phialocephala subalpina]|uniref:Uncharacterized protein n=1 Tax=Phialocephala subalpina TaxID=576137 RepID=A0A1L7XMP2_9HELO|nr:uncharacterized protein PAC_16200 [Phialocephala subalpina]
MLEAPIRLSSSASSRELEDIRKRTTTECTDAASLSPLLSPLLVPAVKAKPLSPVKVSPMKTSPPKPEPISQPAPRPYQSPLASPPPAAIPTFSSSDNGSVESSLEQIKNLLEAQTKTINAQSEKIGKLAQEVDTLKIKVRSGAQGQSERIRQLELELEAARS